MTYVQSGEVSQGSERAGTRRDDGDDEIRFMACSRFSPEGRLVSLFECPRGHRRALKCFS
jgi:hypothetical protein